MESSIKQFLTVVVAVIVAMYIDKKFISKA
jgi:hypothetical protein